MRAVIQDVRDSLHLSNCEDFTGRVVRRVEDEDLSFRLRKFSAQDSWVKLPDSIRIKGKWDALNVST